MSRRNVGKIAVFSGLFQYFGLQRVYPTVFTFNMTRYNTKTQKSYVKEDLKQKMRKNGDGNVFQKLIKLLTKFLEKIK